jgi:DNA replication and repair protein RecF
VRVSRLWLTDFRCYETADFEPAPQTTLITGGNGEGKTSLLEALGWLATASSFRGTPDHALVRAGCTTAVVRAEVEREGRQQLVEAEIAASGRNRIQVNRQRLGRTRDLLGTLRITVFAPDDLELVKGGPGERRRYLDDLLVAMSPRYDAVRSDYERVLRHRNSLLRSGMRGADAASTLEVWNAQLVRAGAELVRARVKLTSRLAKVMAQAYDDVASQSAAVSGTYEAEWMDSKFGGPKFDEQSVDAQQLDDVEPALATALEALHKRELERGVTLAGPHRDEWRLRVGDFDARLQASQGEQRSLAFALRIAGHTVVTDVIGDPPVLLLDDVFSELDPGRAEALVAFLPPGQALLTTAASVPPSLAVERRVRVAGGRLECVA